MNCGGAQRLMIRYIDGLLDPGRRQLFEMHIDLCEDCQQEYRIISDTNSVLAESYSAEEVDPEAIAERVMDNLPPKEPVAKRLGFDRRVLLVLLLFVPLIVVASVHMSRAPSGVLTILQGEGAIIDRSGVREGVKQRTRIKPGTSVEMSQESEAALKLGGASIVLGPETSLELRQNSSAFRLVLGINMGSVEVMAEGKREFLWIETGAGTLVAGLSNFEVRAGATAGEGPPRQVVTLVVHRGSVRWTSILGTETVGAGMTAILTPGKWPAVSYTSSLGSPRPEGRR